MRERDAQIEPAAAGEVGVPLQPPMSGISWSTLRSWAPGTDLRAIALSAEAEVDELTLRRLVDQELRDELAAAGFQGDSYLEWQDMMARYAVSVQAAWMHSGQEFKMLRDRGIRLGISDTQRQVLKSRKQVRLDLAGEVVARTFGPFRERALIDGGWRADGGAGLPTYFMGATLYRFPNVFRSWQSEWDTEHKDSIIDLVEVVPEQIVQKRTEMPETSVLDADELERILSLFSKNIRDVLRYRLLGYSLVEIATLTGRTERAVEGILYRARPKLKECS